MGPGTFSLPESGERSPSAWQSRGSPCSMEEEGSQGTALPSEGAPSPGPPVGHRHANDNTEAQTARVRRPQGSTCNGQSFWLCERQRCKLGFFLILTSRSSSPLSRSAPTQPAGPCPQATCQLLHHSDAKGTSMPCHCRPWTLV